MEYATLADEILAVDEVIQYVSIVDREGRIVFSKIREGKKYLADEKEEKVLASDLGVIKAMQGLSMIH